MVRLSCWFSFDEKFDKMLGWSWFHQPWDPTVHKGCHQKKLWQSSELVPFCCMFSCCLLFACSVCVCRFLLISLRKKKMKLQKKQKKCFSENHSQLQKLNGKKFKKCVALVITPFHLFIQNTQRPTQRPTKKRAQATKKPGLPGLDYEVFAFVPQSLAANPKATETETLGGWW